MKSSRAGAFGEGNYLLMGFCRLLVEELADLSAGRFEARHASGSVFFRTFIAQSSKYDP